MSHERNLFRQEKTIPNKHQGSDKGGGVVQMVLVDTERNAQGAQLQNASACTFFQLQNEEHNSFWLGK